MSKVLVAYATKHGSTAEIAQAIGEVLALSGHDVEVMSASDVHDVTAYDAAVIGSALYMGHWQREALNLLKRHERELRAYPTWLFSSGPTGGSDKTEPALEQAEASVTAIPPLKEVAQRAERISARGHATFPGKVGEEATGLLERWLPRGDWRDFDAIRRWAGEISGELVAGVPVGGGRTGPV
jgi:menaquinone-dependent protoporphyrinogen oxidase